MIVKLKGAMKVGKKIYLPGFYSDEGKGGYPLINENGKEIPEDILDEVEAKTDLIEIVKTSTKKVSKKSDETSDKPANVTSLASRPK